MKVEIPHRLMRLNEYIAALNRNRFVGNNMKRTNTELVAWSVKTLPKITKPALYTFTWYVKNKRSDPDNIIAGGTKVIMDGLVEAGKLPADSLKWVLGFDHRFVVGKEDKVIVEIVEYE